MVTGRISFTFKAVNTFITNIINNNCVPQFNQQLVHIQKSQSFDFLIF